MSDGELVERARQGDSAAFGELVERHRVAAYRAALVALGSHEDAEDIAQEAFVTAYLKLAGFRHESSFKTWLLAIVWRAALDRRKSITHRMRRFVTGTAEDWGGVPGRQRSQEQTLLGAEFTSQVTLLVRKLPAKLRDPLLLWASGEYSYTEMSEALDVPAGTLKWRVMEGRRQLKHKLARLGYTNE